MSKHYHVETHYLNSDGTRERFDAGLPCIKDVDEAIEVAYTFTLHRAALYRARIPITDYDVPRVRLKEGMDDYTVAATIKDGSGVEARVVEVDAPMHGDPGYEEYLAEKLGLNIVGSTDSYVVAQATPAMAEVLKSMGIGRELKPEEKYLFFGGQDQPVH